MEINTAVLIAIIGAVVSVSTFFIGRTSNANKTGREWGELKTDIRYIKDDITEIKGTLGASAMELRAAIAKEAEDRKQSVRRLHNRLDEHLRDEHRIYLENKKQEGL